MQCRISRKSLLHGLGCLAATLGVAALFASCRQEMADQPRYDPYQESAFFGDSLSARPLPPGVVARTASLNRVSTSDDFPFEVTGDVLRRGKERFNIFCSPCHGLSGEGDGIVTVRGFRRPPPTFHSERLRNVSPGYLYDVIRNGFGAMPPYAYQVPHPDRWAIAAYIQALQLSQWAPVESVPASELGRLEESR
jgi:mono/diheme cytochrome c family protein